MTYEIKHNRMRAMRMRDGDRWVNAYRVAAMEQALHEARHRSFLSALYFAVTHMTRTFTESRTFTE